MEFKEFNLKEELQAGLRDIGYTKPTPIQEKTIPIILEKRDLIGAAQTGTGKTGAFVIPIIQQILENPSGQTQALILSPTRELAQQIDEQIFALGYHTGLSSATVIGGEDFARQANALRSGVDIIVATPGRLIDQTKVLDIDFSHIKYLVLDEADRMLDMGFLPDVTKIIKKLPSQRQTLLFSATMPNQIQKLAQDIMKDPEKIEIEISKPSNSIQQRAYLVDARQKLTLIQHILDEYEWDSCIIFCATKRGTDQLESLLTKKGINAGSIHGDRNQDERNAALHQFKNGVIPVIVATDVIARGIDIADVSLIINYDVPRAVEDYIHRIGRTGRYDKSGIAVTLVGKKDSRAFQAIQDKVGDQLEVLELPKVSKTDQNITGKATTTGGKTTSSKKPAGKNKGKKSKSSSNRDDARNTQKSSDKNGQTKSKNEVQPNAKKESKKTHRPKGKSKLSLAESRKRVENLKSVKVKLKSQGSEKIRSKNQPDGAASAKRSSTPRYETERIKKATSRNQKTRKPAKGFWGIVKSLLPKFKK